MDKFVSNIMNMFMFYISCSLYLFCAAYMRHLPFISKARHTLLITTIHTSKKLLEFKHLFLPKCKLRTYWIATVFKENVANYILCEFQIVFRGGPNVVHATLCAFPNIVLDIVNSQCIRCTVLGIALNAQNCRFQISDLGIAVHAQNCRFQIQIQYI